MYVDKDLKEDINRLDLKLIRTIFSNERKRRYTLLVEKKGKLNVLKWNHPKELTHLNKLRKEIIFYKENYGKEFIPKLVYQEDNLILLEHIDGKTLREWIIDYRNQIEIDDEKISKDFKIMVDNLMNYIKNFYVQDNDVISNEEVVSSLKHYYKSLYFSVPMSIKRGKVENLFLRILNKLCNRSIARNFDKIYLYLKEKDIKIQSYNIHSDLHLNNILVSSENLEIKVIDWENLVRGSILSDLNYLYAFIIFLLEGLPLHQQFIYYKFDTFLKGYDPRLNKVFIYINKLFSMAISVNRSFGYNLPIDYLIGAIKNYLFEINNYSLEDL